MDIMPEKGPQQSSEIPANWGFEDLLIGTNYRVSQINEENGFLALVNDRNGYHVEMEFDRRGDMKSRRRSVWVEDPHKEAKGAGWFESNVELFADTFVRYFAGLLYDSEHREDSFLNVYFEVGTDRNISPHLGIARYGLDGMLQKVSFEGPFFPEQTENQKSHWPKVESAPAANLKLIRSSLKGAKLGGSREDWKEELEYMEGFQTVWEIDEEKGALVLSQKHETSGITKVLTAPLRVDVDKIREFMLKRPPYPEERFRGRTMIDVPWTHIPELVSARLSYIKPNLPQEATKPPY